MHIEAYPHLLPTPFILYVNNSIIHTLFCALFSFPIRSLCWKILPHDKRRSALRTTAVMTVQCAFIHLVGLLVTASLLLWIFSLPFLFLVLEHKFMGRCFSHLLWGSGFWFVKHFHRTPGRWLWQKIFQRQKAKSRAPMNDVLLKVIEVPAST